MRVKEGLQIGPVSLHVSFLHNAQIHLVIGVCSTAQLAVLYHAIQACEVFEVSQHVALPECIMPCKQAWLCSCSLKLLSSRLKMLCDEATLGRPSITKQHCNARAQYM